MSEPIKQPDLFASAAHKPKRKKRRRTADFGIEFADGQIVGWAFGVPEAARAALDIFLGDYVDRARSTALRKSLGAYDENGKWRNVQDTEWRRGVPPALSFDTGDIFYRPPAVAQLVWGEALKLLEAVVQVKDAQPDSDDGSGGGWVDIELAHYKDGVVTHKEHLVITQGQFEALLRTGEIQRST